MMQFTSTRVLAGMVLAVVTMTTVCLSGEPTGTAGGAGSATSQPAGRVGDVLKELRKIQPPMYEAPGIEDALVAMGKDALPALRQARAMGVTLVGDDELTTDTYRNPNGQGVTVDTSPRPQRVERLARLRADVLARAAVRLDFGFNPPDALANRWPNKRY